MGNKKSRKGDTVMATSTRLFKEELWKILKEKRRIFTSTPVVVLSTILGRTPGRV
jgi:aconitate hydratase 2/2-methylisocitrate dehydratase